MSKNPHAVALGRKGGKVRSLAKTKACRENAKRPRPRVEWAGEIPATDPAREILGCGHWWLRRETLPGEKPRAMMADGGEYAYVKRLTAEDRNFEHRVRGTQRMCIRPWGHSGPHRGPRIFVSW